MPVENMCCILQIYWDIEINLMGNLSDVALLLYKYMYSGSETNLAAHNSKLTSNSAQHFLESRL